MWEDEALRAATEEALQEAELVGFGPHALELEGRLAGRPRRGGASGCRRRRRARSGVAGSGV